MKINKSQKELIKAYICLFAIMYIAINWSSISWLFNYRTMSSLVHGFLNPYENSALLVSADNAVAPISKNPENIKQYPYSQKSNSIEIPSLGITAPIVISQSMDKSSITKDLDNGVVYYPGSVLPGENGQIIMLGHSAPPGWPQIKYDWVFSKINELNPGDSIILHFNHSKYIYRVIGQDIIKPGQEVTSDQFNGGNNILAIVSCWPPGKDYQRIAVQAELESI